MTTTLDEITELEKILSQPPQWLPEHSSNIEVIIEMENEEYRDIRYQELRLQLIQNKEIENLLPSFLRKYNTREKVWSFLRNIHHDQQEATQFIWDEFAPLIIYIENKTIFDKPLDFSIKQSLGGFDSDDIKNTWQKALER